MKSNVNVSIGSLYFYNGIYFSRVVLQNPSEETLSEIKPWNPEVGRLSFVYPVLDEVEPIDEVDDPRCHWFQTGIRDSVPLFRNSVIVNGIGQLLINTLVKVKTSSSSLDMETSPSIALLSCSKLLVTSTIIRLNRINSC
jgi:hypothetical protein